jgi:hypothetical protein
MYVRTYFLIACIALLGALNHPSLAAIPAGLPSLLSDQSANTAECPPVANLQVEMLPGGKALAFWDPVPAVDKYFVRVEGPNQSLILDTVVASNQVVISGLAPGLRYHIQVCYLCPYKNDLSCVRESFDYIIIEEVIVMLTGNPCSCKLNPDLDGTCPSNSSNLYSLANNRVYHIQMPDSSRLSFITDNGVVRLVGNCPLDFDQLDTEAHGALQLQLPVYNFGGAKIHFHGQSFCVDGVGDAEVRYCDWEKTGKERLDPSESELETAATLYPNPFSDILSIRVPSGADKPWYVQMYNNTGQLMRVFTMPSGLEEGHSAVLPVADMAPGMYWMQVYGAGFESFGMRAVKL